MPQKQGNRIRLPEYGPLKGILVGRPFRLDIQRRSLSRQVANGSAGSIISIMLFIKCGH
jgi:hypothetical protein